ncbi:MAG: phage virion morphogenesis protein, partial [Sphingobacteriales bacterium]
FLGRAARIAQVHQEGLVDQVDKDGPSYRYPVRRLLGFTQAECEQIQQVVLDHLAGLQS